MLYHHGVCPHPVTIVRKAEQLGVNHDQEALEWKESIEKAEKKLRHLESFRSTLKEAMYVEEPSISVFESELAERKSGPNVIEEAPDLQCHDFKTLDVNGLHFACLASPKETAKAIFQKHAELHSEDSAVQCFDELVATGKKEDICHPTKAGDVAFKTLKHRLKKGVSVSVFVTVI